MSAESVVYHLNSSIIIREEARKIKESVTNFNFDLDSSMVSLNTIQAHLTTLLDDLEFIVDQATQKKFEFIKSWLNSFFRMIYKDKTTQPKHDYLFYGAALTIEKFLDDYHL